MNVISTFVNNGSDMDLLKSMYDSNPTEDLEKALKKEGLVLVDVQVQGKHGTYTRKQWVKADQAKKGGKSKSTNSKEDSKDSKLRTRAEQAKELNAMATEALKYDDDDKWTAANELENCEYDGDTKRASQMKAVMSALGAKDPNKVTITHADNAENLDKFSDFYDKLSKLPSDKSIPYGDGGSAVEVHNIGGKRYATEYGDGGAMAIYHVE